MFKYLLPTIAAALCSFSATAHNFNFVKADLAIDNTNGGYSEYRVEFTTTLNYMVDRIIGVRDPDLHSISELEKMSDIELEVFAERIIELHLGTTLLLDGTPKPLTKIYGISGHSLKEKIANMKDDHDVYISFYGAGVIDSGHDKIQVVFPEKLGDVEIHLVRPIHPKVKAGKASPEFPIVRPTKG